MYWHLNGFVLALYQWVVNKVILTNPLRNGKGKVITLNKIASAEFPQ